MSCPSPVYALVWLTVCTEEVPFVYHGTVHSVHFLWSLPISLSAVRRDRHATREN